MRLASTAGLFLAAFGALALSAAATNASAPRLYSELGLFDTTLYYLARNSTVEEGIYLGSVCEKLLKLKTNYPQCHEEYERYVRGKIDVMSEDAKQFLINVAREEQSFRKQATACYQNESVECQFVLSEGQTVFLNKVISEYGNLSAEAKSSLNSTFPTLLLVAHSGFVRDWLAPLFLQLIPDITGSGGIAFAMRYGEFMAEMFVADVMTAIDDGTAETKFTRGYKRFVYQRANATARANLAKLEELGAKDLYDRVNDKVRQNAPGVSLVSSLIDTRASIERLRGFLTETNEVIDPHYKKLSRRAKDALREVFPKTMAVVDESSFKKLFGIGDGDGAGADQVLAALVTQRPFGPNGCGADKGR